jgi:MoaA/NifB/PqqE/SkfB family radical SAM enzyme
MFDSDTALRLLGMQMRDRAFIGPEIVQIDLTDLCTNRCLGCWARSPMLREDDAYDTLTKGQLSTGFVLELLDQLAAINVRAIFFGGGGDPLCHDGFSEILRKAKALGFHCTVNTNLTQADAGVIDTFIEAGLDQLIVSLWAADREMYGLLHPDQPPETFDQVEQTIRAICEKKNGPAPHIKIYDVICATNHRQIPDMVQHARDLGVEEIEFSIFDPIPGRTDDQLLSRDQIDWVLELFEGFESKPPLTVTTDLFLRRLADPGATEGAYDRGLTDRPHCAAGWFYARVTTVGQVHSCLKAHRVPAGDLSDKPFESIWFDAPQNRFRENTVELDPGLENIGHDLGFEGPGCFRICDNLGFNEHVARLTAGLSNEEKHVLDAMEKAARDGATVEQLREIHRAGNRAEAAPIQIVADHPILHRGLDAKGDFEILCRSLETCAPDMQIIVSLGIENVARLPRILALIGKLTGRPVDAPIGQFSFSPLQDAHERIGPFLTTVIEKAAAWNIRIEPDTEKIQSVLSSFFDGLKRFSEPDLLRALGVLTNEQLVGPRTFHLDVANACNTNCAYCWFHSPYSVDRPDRELFDADWRKQMMPWEMFEGLVNDLVEVGCFEDVVLSGKGEPLLHPQITEMLVALKSRGIFTTLFTNGLKLVERIAETCIENRVDLLYVSLSAASREVFGNLQDKQSPEAFDAIVENIRTLVRKRNAIGARKPEVVLVDVLCNENVHEVIDFAKLGVELGVDHLRFQLAAIEPYNKPLAISDEQFKALPETIERAKEIARKAGVEVIANIDAQLERGDPNWSGEKYLDRGCLSGWAFARAWADGSLSFCCSPKPIGGLAEQGFADWWRGEVYDRYRLAGKFLTQNRDLKFGDGTSLWTEICRRCPNYEGVGQVEKVLDHLNLLDEK